MRDVYTAIVFVGHRALAHWGERMQVIKACEEMSELTTKLCKALNGSPVDDEAIVDEIADVMIMNYQLRHMFGADVVDARIAFKLERLDLKLNEIEMEQTQTLKEEIKDET